MKKTNSKHKRQTGKQGNGGTQGVVSGTGGHYSGNPMFGNKTRKDEEKKKNRKDRSDEMTIAELDKEVDFETLVKREYQHLHRQYRLMETSSLQITREGNSLSKQKRLLELLLREEEDLKTMLYKATCEKFQNLDRANIKSILNILEDFETLQNELNLCLRDVKELETNVDKITKKLVQQRLKVQALYGRAMSLPQANKKKVKLENQLYFYTTKYDTKISLNKGLRQEINMMLKLRGLFHERLVNFKKQSNQIRINMGEVVYLSNQAYDDRDDAVAKIHSIRDKNDRDTKLHINEIKDFKRNLHNDLKGRYFRSVKNQDRELMESQSQRIERRNLAKLVQLDQIFHSYVKSIKEVLSTSNHDTLEQLVSYYGAHEQDNFSKFRFITDINSEVAVLQDETIRIAQGIDELYLQTKILVEEQNNEIEQLEDEFIEVQIEHAKLLEELNKSEFQMGEIFHILESIFTVTNCPASSLQRLLGKYTTITSSNAILCIKIIEHVTHQLIQEKAILESRKTVEIDNIPIHHAHATKPIKITKSQPQGGPFVPNIIVTGRLDGEENDDEETDKNANHAVMSYRTLREFVQNKFDKIASMDQGTKTMLQIEASTAPSEITPNPNDTRSSRTKSDVRARRSRITKSDQKM